MLCSNDRNTTRYSKLFRVGNDVLLMQTEKCFLRRTRRRKKRTKLALPPAGGKLCEAFFDKLRAVS